MPTRVRIALGLMTAWAALYAFAALVMDLSPAQDQGSVVMGATRAVFVIDMLVVFVAYTYIALQSPRIPGTVKTAWVVGMLFFYPFAVLLFWYLHIWRVAAPPAAQSTGPQ